MEIGRGQGIIRVTACQRWLLAAVALAASMGANAGTDTASFRVGLRLTASCQVDSSLVTEATSAAAAAASGPAVTCGHAMPRTVRVTREIQVPPANGEAAAEGVPAIVVTLSF